MKYLLVPDKFKGSATAEEVVDALSKGIRSADKEAHIDAVIASDGGDGFLHTVEAYQSVQKISIESVDAIGQPIPSYYLYQTDTATAYIELANTAGITKINPSESTLLKSSTFGVGIQIKDALSLGAKRIYIGLGGSASNDAGMGIAAALGVEFYDTNQNKLAAVSKNLSIVASVKLPHNLTQNCEFFAVNDVENPLYGEMGAAYVYAPQKGASKKLVKELDAGLKSFDAVLNKELLKEGAHIKGAGAAGGTAYGLFMFLKAQMIPGFNFMSQLSGLENLLETNTYDYIITGEGKFDHQSLQGKLIDGILKLSKFKHSPILVVCGSCTLSDTDIEGTSIQKILPIVNTHRDVANCIANPQRYIQETISEFLTQ